MVMEEMPSPHCVGREFVRQYYTLLNQAPMHLHRFYNENSSFVHGGLDTPNRETKPVIGQRQIHHRIQQLEFNDCHAKIRQVDSQATLGNGVVVQVTGELSNNGEPMRRFTQTFVLAQQSPKKYYVHNDIFRYQDEMIADEECEPDSGRSEAEEDMEEVSQTDAPGGVQQQVAFYMQPQPPQTTVVAAAPASQGQSATVLVSAINGSALPEGQPAVMMPPVAASSLPVTVLATTASVTTEADEVDADDEADEIKTIQEPPPQQQQEPEQQQQTVSVSMEPKTYATLLKSGGTGGSAASVLRAPSPTNISQESSTSPNANSGGAAGSSVNAGSPSQQSLPQRQSQQQQSQRSSSGAAGSVTGGGAGGMRSGAGPRSGQMRSDDRREIGNRDSGSDERRRMSGGPIGAGSNMYPDNQQVFVGNVPVSASEENMKEIFSKFGHIVDVRLNCKPSNKCPPGKVFPKYGFIVFSEPAAVQLCLQSRPIAMPGDTSHNLNVEEKRNKFRSSISDDRDRGMGGRSSMGRAGSSGGMMRGRGEGGGMSRGGRGGGIRGGSEGGNRGGGGGGGGGGMMQRGGVGGTSYANRR